MSFRRSVLNILKAIFYAFQSLLIRLGFVLKRTKWRYGMDVFLDIRRIAKAWNYPIELFIDVGANDGDTALTALRELPSARIVSIEAHPSTFQKLLARMGGRSRFEAINIALGDRVGEVEMVEFLDSRLNSLVPDAPYPQRFGAKGNTITVPVTTLDALCRERAIERVDVLKIDTEGYDLVVLEGSTSMLSQGAVKFIYVEFNDLFPQDGTHGGALQPISELLRRYGFRFVATYNDYTALDGGIFAVSNALFVLPRS